MRKKRFSIIVLSLSIFLLLVSSCSNDKNSGESSNLPYSLGFKSTHLNLTYNSKALSEKEVNVSQQDYNATNYTIFFQNVLPFEKETEIDGVQLKLDKAQQRNYFSGEYKSTTGKKVTYSGYITTLKDGKMSDASLLKLDLADQSGEPILN